MKEVNFEVTSGSVPYLAKYTSVPPGTVNSSCTTICETFDELNDESDKSHNTQCSLMEENEFGSMNYKCVSEYDVFNMGLMDSNYFNNISNSNQMNNQTLNRELSNIQMSNLHLSSSNVNNSSMNHMDYSNSCLNFYPENPNYSNNINEYSNSLGDYSNNLNDYPNDINDYSNSINNHEEKSINEYNVNSNIAPKYVNDNCSNYVNECNNSYTSDGYGVEGNYVSSENLCKDEGFGFDGFKGGNYYANDLKYNISHYTNAEENPLDNSGDSNSCNVPIHSSTINLNHTNPINTYDNPNSMNNYDPQNAINAYDNPNPMSNYDPQNPMNTCDNSNNMTNYDGQNQMQGYNCLNPMTSYPGSNVTSYAGSNPMSNFSSCNYEDGMYDMNSFNNMNCISGVKYQRTDNRWIARWTTAEGKRACKSFSVNIYGFNQAKMLAIQARQKGVALSGRSFCNRERQHAMKSGVGIIGIRFDKTQARWVSSYYEGGKRKFRYFTVKDYGYEQAKRNAIIWKSCNDERLVKRVKEGYGMNYGVANIMPNIMYPVEGHPYGCGINNSMITNAASNNTQVNSLDHEAQKDMELDNQNFNKVNFTQANDNINSFNPETQFNGENNVFNGNCLNNSEYMKDYGNFNNSDVGGQLNNLTHDGELEDGYKTMTVGNFSNFDQNESTISSGRNYFYCSDSDESGDSETTGIESDACHESDDDVEGGNDHRVSYDGKRGRWVSMWRDEEGKKVKKYFEVHKFGYKKAKQMALANNKLI